MSEQGSARKWHFIQWFVVSSSSPHCGFDRNPHFFSANFCGLHRCEVDCLPSGVGSWGQLRFWHKLTSVSLFLNNYALTMHILRYIEIVLDFDIFALICVVVLLCVIAIIKYLTVVRKLSVIDFTLYFCFCYLKIIICVFLSTFQVMQ